MFLSIHRKPSLKMALCGVFSAIGREVAIFAVDVEVLACQSFRVCSDMLPVSIDYTACSAASDNAGRRFKHSIDLL
jgi:hypothetical protein